ncbi:MAG: hypothetical protein R3E34_01860 [Rhodocyclaceae bacterium]
MSDTLGRIELVPCAPSFSIVRVRGGNGERILLAYHAVAQVVVLRTHVAQADARRVALGVEDRLRNDLDRAAGTACREQVAGPLGDLDALDVLCVDEIGAVKPSGSVIGTPSRSTMISRMP